MGDAACGRDGEFYAAARRHLIRLGFAVPPVSLRVGRSADLTGHRPVIQYREPPRGKAFFARGRFLFGFVYLFLVVQVRPVRDRSDKTP